MTLHRLRLFALALVAGVVTTTVQAVERDVVGWEWRALGHERARDKGSFQFEAGGALGGGATW